MGSGFYKKYTYLRFLHQVKYIYLHKMIFPPKHDQLCLTLEPNLNLVFNILCIFYTSIVIHRSYPVLTPRNILSVGKDGPGIWPDIKSSIRLNIWCNIRPICVIRPDIWSDVRYTAFNI